jgi:glucosylceramidase
MRKSRRSFLKSALAGAAISSIFGKAQLLAEPTMPADGVRAWSTFRNAKHEEVTQPSWKPIAQYNSNAVILDPRACRQEILGFGAALTDSSCYVLSQLPEEARRKTMHEVFSAEQMCLNVCQTCIGASDYSRSLYSLDDSDRPDPELTQFSVDHDKAYILPILREARQLNPELYLFATPWSPPGWMKSGGSMLGGVILKRFYHNYAEYFRRFIEEYGREGIRLDAATVQNELDTDQDGTMPACIWGQEYEIQFVRDHLGPILHDAGITAKIWILNHNYNLWGRAIGELSDVGANRFIDGVAWHGYSGEPTAMTTVHNAFPEKAAYWTEGGPDITAPDYLTDWTRWATTFIGIMRNWARSITAWNLALDEKGNPKIGPFSCGGLITIENETHTVKRSGQYWAMSHCSKHVRRGARVFATEGIAGNSDHGAALVSHIGFRNPDGTFVVVLANQGPGMRIQLVLNSDSLDVELPADSIKTIEWL